ncbi:hypothetical protein AZI86_07145 [Bdellovibrio bacteriovorus]|uniref:Uncharacterized protein n=1 Tax=Bdellovibrio bacteriovorus TaxID=959 RepID=A0A150WR03_BDEBC|nr:hypothetical protein [Bdellovibrio bacteriovorus]KYG66806.1 hypothetical protein AZI86_07145 [Bdellovibrio bacteriovorus]
MDKNLHLIQTLALLEMELNRIGPSMIEQQLLSPNESWILGSLSDTESVATIVRVMQTLNTEVVSHEQFKELFMISAKPWGCSNTSIRIIEHFYLAKLHGFKVQTCCHAAALALDNADRPEISKVDALYSGLRKVWYENCPNIEKNSVNIAFIKDVERKLSKHAGPRTLISKSLSLEDDLLKKMTRHMPIHHLLTFLMSLNKEDDYEKALSQKMWSFMSEDEKVELTWSMYQEQATFNRAEAFSIWEKKLNKEGLYRKSPIKRKVA